MLNEFQIGFIEHFQEFYNKTQFTIAKEEKLIKIPSKCEKVGPLFIYFEKDQITIDLNGFHHFHVDRFCFPDPDAVLNHEIYGKAIDSVIDILEDRVFFYQASSLVTGMKYISKKEANWFVDFVNDLVLKYFAKKIISWSGEIKLSEFKKP